MGGNFPGGNFHGGNFPRTLKRGGEALFEIERPTSMEELCTMIDKGVGGLENWTIFMDVICVSSFPAIELASSFC